MRRPVGAASRSRSGPWPVSSTLGRPALVPRSWPSWVGAVAPTLRRPIIACSRSSRSTRVSPSGLSRRGISRSGSSWVGPAASTLRWPGIASTRSRGLAGTAPAARLARLSVPSGPSGWSVLALGRLRPNARSHCQTNPQQSGQSGCNLWHVPDLHASPGDSRLWFGSGDACHKPIILGADDGYLAASFVEDRSTIRSLSTLKTPGAVFACTPAIAASMSFSTTPYSVRLPLFTMMWIA